MRKIQHIPSFHGELIARRKVSAHGRSKTCTENPHFVSASSEISKTAKVNPSGGNPSAEVFPFPNRGSANGAELVELGMTQMQRVPNAGVVEAWDFTDASTWSLLDE